MNDDTKDRQAIYEIGYLITPKTPEEKVPAEAEGLKKIITDAGASVITEEAPAHQELAYTIRSKTSTGAYDSFDEAYFGWIKFEVGSDKIEAVKKAIEIRPSVLRMLLVSTVRENTYLGKRAAVAVASAIPGPISAKAAVAPEDDQKIEAAKQKKEAPATIEEMDKSIDEMVKEV